MDIVFFLSGIEDRRYLFEQEVITVVPERARVFCNSLEELTTSLRQSITGSRVCVIVIADKQTLLELFTIRTMLQESKLILLLPDKSPDTVELGHMFYPRFLDSIQCSYRDVSAVLKKMIRNHGEETIYG